MQGNFSATTTEKAKISLGPRKNYDIGFDLWLVVCFVGALMLLNYGLQLCRKLTSLWLRAKAAIPAPAPKRSENNALASAALQIIQKEKPGPQDPSGSKELEKFNNSIKQNKHNPSMDPFEILSRMQESDLKPNIITYNLLLEATFATKNYEKAQALFLSMKDIKCTVRPDIATYNLYLKGMAEALAPGCQHSLAGLEDLLADMRVQKVVPNVATFNCILEQCLSMKQAEAAWHYFKVMQEEWSIQADGTTFTVLLKLHRDGTHKAQYAEALFDEICHFLERSQGVVDDTLLNDLLDAYMKDCNCDKLDRLLELLPNCKQRGMQGLYGKLITLYAQHKKVGKVAHIHGLMQKAQLELVAATYGRLIEAYSRCDAIDPILQLYEHMTQDPHRQTAFNVMVYTTLIRAFAKAKLFDRAFEAFQRLQNDPKVSSNIIAYNAMLDACIKCGRYEIMEVVFTQLVTASRTKTVGEPLLPDLITYSTLIKGLTKNGQMDKALELYGEMKSKGMKLDDVLFNSLLCGLGKQPGSTTMVDRLLDDMKTQHITLTNYTYSILIKLYAKNQEPLKALSVYDQLKQSGASGGLVVFTCLMQVCVKFKMIERGIALYYDMTQQSIVPDPVAYNTIVNGCIYAGKFPQACQILEDAMGRKVRLADDIYNNVLRNLLSYHKMPLPLKQTYAVHVCDYIAANSIPVTPEYLREVHSRFVARSIDSQSKPVLHGKKKSSKHQ